MDAMKKPRFLALDLEIVSRTRPSALIDEMDGKALVLFAGRTPNGYLTVIQSGDTSRRAPAAMAKLRQLITSLGRKGRRQYDKADHRDFSFGYEASDPLPCEAKLAETVVAEIGKLNGRVSVVVYGRQAPKKTPVARQDA